MLPQSPSLLKFSNIFNLYASMLWRRINKLYSTRVRYIYIHIYIEGESLLASHILQAYRCCWAKSHQSVYIISPIGLACIFNRSSSIRNVLNAKLSDLCPRANRPVDKFDQEDNPWFPHGQMMHFSGSPSSRWRITPRDQNTKGETKKKKTQYSSKGNWATRNAFSIVQLSNGRHY